MQPDSVFLRQEANQCPLLADSGHPARLGRPSDANVRFRPEADMHQRQGSTFQEDIVGDPYNTADQDLRSAHRATTNESGQMERPSRGVRLTTPKPRRKFKPKFIPTCIIVVGLLAWAIGAFFILTGVSSFVGRLTYSVATRAEDPAGFWMKVVFVILLGGFFIREGIRGCLEPRG